MDRYNYYNNDNDNDNPVEALEGLGLSVATVYDGSGDNCPCCVTIDQETPLAA